MFAALGSGGPGGGFERLHFLLARALHFSGSDPEITPQFLKAFDAAMPFDTNPLYAILHETCYTQGPATRWSAQRVQDQMFSKVFDAEVCLIGSIIQTNARKDSTSTPFVNSSVALMCCHVLVARASVRVHAASLQHLQCSNFRQL